jgi:hypothetical protein
VEICLRVLEANCPPKIGLRTICLINMNVIVRVKRLEENVVVIVRVAEIADVAM